MSGAVPDLHPIIQWGWAGSALESASGDLHVVTPFVGGTLVALVDGLGHGAEAAEAAAATVPLLEAHAGEQLPRLLQRCHEGLRKTRGAVMSLACFDSQDSSMTWAGVGNVAAVLLRVNRLLANGNEASEALVSRGGVVGYRLPPLQAKALQVAPGDTLVMATDGIRWGFTAGLEMACAPQEIAEAILAGFATGADDAHVVVARYVGSPA
ncbi:MAG TPA: SpoIIE family protein phosphatase [Ideonella sp.]|uniref:SpoIIE family protein phosphatase n=1 Tax=Ideonella sp. TaxID=1929293 RepID=UPI002C11A112|nr:SpoIIE family protein phosphatase [Ideonella sp.]HSI51737.1 SpoIIE family protein phosphatase [Ideonella sp.]